MIYTIVNILRMNTDRNRICPFVNTAYDYEGILTFATDLQPGFFLCGNMAGREEVRCMIAWNGHGFEIVTGEEEEELRRQEAEIAELIRRHRQRREAAAREQEQEE